MVHLIEFWDYLVQFLACAAGCTGAVRAFTQNRRQPYFLLACFFGTYGLGTLYWTLHVLLWIQRRRCSTYRNWAGSRAISSC